MRRNIHTTQRITRSSQRQLLSRIRRVFFGCAVLVVSLFVEVLLTPETHAAAELILSTEQAKERFYVSESVPDYSEIAWVGDEVTPDGFWKGTEGIDGKTVGFEWRLDYYMPRSEDVVFSIRREVDAINILRIRNVTGGELYVHGAWWFRFTDDPNFTRERTEEGHNIVKPGEEVWFYHTDIVHHGILGLEISSPRGVERVVQYQRLNHINYYVPPDAKLLKYGEAGNPGGVERLDGNVILFHNSVQPSVSYVRPEVQANIQRTLLVIGVLSVLFACSRLLYSEFIRIRVTSRFIRKCLVGVLLGTLGIALIAPNPQKTVLISNAYVDPALNGGEEIVIPKSTPTQRIELTSRVGAYLQNVLYSTKSVDVLVVSPQIGCSPLDTQLRVSLVESVYVIGEFDNACPPPEYLKKKIDTSLSLDEVLRRIQTTGETRDYVYGAFLFEWSQRIIVLGFLLSLMFSVMYVFLRVLELPERAPVEFFRATHTEPAWRRMAKRLRIGRALISAKENTFQDRVIIAIKRRLLRIYKGVKSVVYTPRQPLPTSLYIAQWRKQRKEQKQMSTFVRWMRSVQAPWDTVSIWLEGIVIFVVIMVALTVVGLVAHRPISYHGATSTGLIMFNHFIPGSVISGGNIVKTLAGMAGGMMVLTFASAAQSRLRISLIAGVIGIAFLMPLVGPYEYTTKRAVLTVVGAEAYVWDYKLKDPFSVLNVYNLIRSGEYKEMFAPSIVKRIVDDQKLVDSLERERRLREAERVLLSLLDVSSDESKDPKIRSGIARAHLTYARFAHLKHDEFTNVAERPLGREAEEELLPYPGIEVAGILSPAQREKLLQKRVEGSLYQVEVYHTQVGARLAESVMGIYDDSKLAYPRYVLLARATDELHRIGEEKEVFRFASTYYDTFPQRQAGGASQIAAISAWRNFIATHGDEKTYYAEQTIEFLRKADEYEKLEFDGVKSLRLRAMPTFHLYGVDEAVNMLDAGIRRHEEDIQGKRILLFTKAEVLNAGIRYEDVVRLGREQYNKEEGKTRDAQMWALHVQQAYQDLYLYEPAFQWLDNVIGGVDQELERIAAIAAAELAYEREDAERMESYIAVLERTEQDTYRVYRLNVLLHILKRDVLQAQRSLEQLTPFVDKALFIWYEQKAGDIEALWYEFREGNAEQGDIARTKINQNRAIITELKQILFEEHPAPPLPAIEPLEETPPTRFERFFESFGGYIRTVYTWVSNGIDTFVHEIRLFFGAEEELVQVPVESQEVSLWNFIKHYPHSRGMIMYVMALTLVSFAHFFSKRWRSIAFLAATFFLARGLIRTAEQDPFRFFASIHEGVVSGFTLAMIAIISSYVIFSIFYPVIFWVLAKRIKLAIMNRIPRRKSRPKKTSSL